MNDKELIAAMKKRLEHLKNIEVTNKTRHGSWRDIEIERLEKRIAELEKESAGQE